MKFGQTTIDPYNTAKLSGPIKNVISSHIRATRVQKELVNLPKISFIGIGQGGNRIASEASTFGFPAFLVNSSLTDMKEHYNRIPEENRIFTPVKSTKTGETIESLQGTGKNAEEGLAIAQDNLDLYVKKVFSRDEIKNADFVFLAASLGGGTGNGALNFVLDKLFLLRKKLFAMKNGYENPVNDVGIIVTLPSTSERGVAYRANALTALEELQKKIVDKKTGAVFVIDNEYIHQSEATTSYIETHGETIDSRTLSNAYVSALIIELISFLAFKGNSNIDSTELLQLLGTPGYLNIKRILNDKDIVNSITGITTSEDRNEISNLISEYASKLIEMPDILCEHDYKNSLIALFQTIEPEGFNTERSKELSGVISTRLGLVHSGSTQTSSQQGLSSFLAYVTSSIPRRVVELKEELKTELELEREKEERSKESLSLFEGLDLPQRNGRRKLVETSGDESDIMSLLEERTPTKKELTQEEMEEQLLKDMLEN